jgi:ribonuclease HI
MIAKVLHS